MMESVSAGMRHELTKHTYTPAQTQPAARVVARSGRREATALAEEPAMMLGGLQRLMRRVQASKLPASSDVAICMERWYGAMNWGWAKEV
jgi:hypothetical protein